MIQNKNKNLKSITLKTSNYISFYLTFYKSLAKSNSLFKNVLIRRQPTIKQKNISVVHFQNCFSKACRSSVIELYLLLSVISYYKQILHSTSLYVWMLRHIARNISNDSNANLNATNIIRLLHMCWHMNNLRQSIFSIQ